MLLVLLIGYEKYEKSIFSNSFYLYFPFLYFCKFIHSKFRWYNSSALSILGCFTFILYFNNFIQVTWSFHTELISCSYIVISPILWNSHLFSFVISLSSLYHLHLSYLYHFPLFLIVLLITFCYYNNCINSIINLLIVPLLLCHL